MYALFGIGIVARQETMRVVIPFAIHNAAAEAFYIANTIVMEKLVKNNARPLTVLTLVGSMTYREAVDQNIFRPLDVDITMPFKFYVFELGVEFSE